MSWLICDISSTGCKNLAPSTNVCRNRPVSTKGVPKTDFRGEQNEKKKSGGAKSHFLPKTTKFLLKMTFFF